MYNTGYFLVTYSLARVRSLLPGCVSLQTHNGPHVIKQTNTQIATLLGTDNKLIYLLFAPLVTWGILIVALVLVVIP